MNWNLVRKTLIDRWKFIAAYAAAMSAWVLMLAAIFPSFQNIKGIEDVFQSYPESLTRLFGIEKIDISSFDNLMSMELYGLMIVIIVSTFIIAFARSMVAGEIQEGTIDLLLAQPIQRWKVLTSEGAVLFGGTVAITGATVLSVYAFGAAFGIEVSYSGHAAFMLLAIALFAAIAGYSVLLSAVMREPRRVAMAAAGLTLVFYLVHFAAGYNSVVEKVDWFSIFHYYDPMKVVLSGAVPARDIFILLAFAAVFFSAALALFQRRDIAV